MKVILVDDEYYALEGLRMELEDISGVEVAGMYEDGFKLLEEVARISPDIIFLDIEMPGLNGFELLERLLDAGVNTNIVFVTAYSHYAVKAFEINASDYIVKPVTRARLLKTIERMKPKAEITSKQKTEICCFRHFSILSDGREINSGWRTRKAEELIAYLLCEKGRFVSKEKIAEALWSDLDGEKGVSNLYLAYYYIKKQENKAGIKIPIESERGKMRIHIEDIDCDMIRFDRLLRDRGGKDTANRIEKMEEAVELYKGALLEDGYYDWAVELQQKYEIMFAGLLNELMRYWELQQDNEKKKYYEEKIKNL